MRVPTTKQWRFDAAQTDTLLQAMGSTQMGAITYVAVTCANGNTVDTSCRIGFGAATLPAVTTNNSAGATGIAFSHPGIAHGGGAVAANGGQAIATGALDEDIRITCSAPTGGFIDVVIGYFVIETNVPAA